MGQMVQLGASVMALDQVGIVACDQLDIVQFGEFGVREVIE